MNVFHMNLFVKIQYVKIHMAHSNVFVKTDIKFIIIPVMVCILLYLFKLIFTVFFLNYKI